MIPVSDEASVTGVWRPRIGYIGRRLQIWVVDDRHGPRASQVAGSSAQPVLV
jgi:hypothetical protein